MNNSTTITELVAELLGLNISDIEPDATLESIGADSLDLVDLLLEMEDTFHIDISDQDITLSSTITDLEALITKNE